jgi:hypothetical protein
MSENHKNKKRNREITDLMISCPNCEFKFMDSTLKRAADGLEDVVLPSIQEIMGDEPMRIVQLAMMISETLFYHWDPIGVNLNSDMRDEYDDYVPEVLRMTLLCQEGDEDQLADELEEMMARCIGLDRSREVNLRTANYLIESKDSVLGLRGGSNPFRRKGGHPHYPVRNWTLYRPKPSKEDLEFFEEFERKMNEGFGGSCELKCPEDL